MLIDNIMYYEKELLIEVNQPGNSLYYFFDYDERSYNINMEFQHFHPFYEIHILLDDNANHIMEGKLYGISKFDIACMKPTLLHKSQYPVGPPMRRLVIQFKFPTKQTGVQNELDKILELFELPIPIYRFSHNDLYRLYEPLNDICRIDQANGPLRNLLIHTKFTEFLSLLYSYRNNNCYVPEALDTSSNKIYTITSYIHSHYQENLSLDALSKLFYISSYYLSHQFRAVTGFTLTSYVQMTRIRNAQQLLLYTDNKITDIAELSGFSSFSQFNRVFNQVCGRSPREFKNQTRKSEVTTRRLSL